ncbi:unnamed protein product [Adineta ricciae]|uniref:Uncharacterized protein n=1 Tax=Adineta ricciae TaxID=249248 RepID=A0A813XFW3_ADIRI|nr:unnamed protein product [Adineta ricciae]
MALRLKNQVYGQILIKDDQPTFTGDEILYIFVRESLQHDVDCTELGSKTIQLHRGQAMPIYFQCLYNPNQAHMNFEEIKAIPGGLTISVTIERNDEILYINNINTPLLDHINIQLVKHE